MFVCKDCGEKFEEPIERVDDLGIPDEVRHGYVERYGVCPYCESEDFEEAETCDICGDETLVTYGVKIKYCRTCYEQTMQQFNDFFDGLSENERELLREEGVVGDV